MGDAFGLLMKIGLLRLRYIDRIFPLHWRAPPSWEGRAAMSLIVQVFGRRE